MLLLFFVVLPFLPILLQSAEPNRRRDCLALLRLILFAFAILSLAPRGVGVLFTVQHPLILPVFLRCAQRDVPLSGPRSSLASIDPVYFSNIGISRGKILAEIPKIEKNPYDPVYPGKWTSPLYGGSFLDVALAELATSVLKIPLGPLPRRRPRRRFPRVVVERFLRTSLASCPSVRHNHHQSRHRHFAVNFRNNTRTAVDASRGANRQGRRSFQRKCRLLDLLQDLHHHHPRRRHFVTARLGIQRMNKRHRTTACR